MHCRYDALALFSGGLDSILAAKLMQSQGHAVLGLHFFSPFFGHPERLLEWEREYDLPIVGVDVGQEFVDVLAAWPSHGFGKVLNPCVDCKVLMLRTAAALLPVYGAKYLISGEVLGQRPMSQRLDTLHVIRNEAGVRDVLVRPLSAGLLPPTPLELAGFVDRSRLPSLCGRGRQGQFRLARSLGVTRIPPQAGGCRLGERESARRYWPILRTFCTPRCADFELANVGRQLWRRQDDRATGHWLAMGREHRDNERLAALLRPDDHFFVLASFPGPHAIGRSPEGVAWTDAVVREAAACLASFAPKARRHDGEVEVAVDNGGRTRRVLVRPDALHAFTDTPTWARTREERKRLEKIRDPDGQGR